MFFTRLHHYTQLIRKITKFLIDFGNFIRVLSTRVNINVFNQSIVQCCVPFANTKIQSEINKTIIEWNNLFSSSPTSQLQC